MQYASSPATKAAELIDRLTSFASATPLDQLAIKRLERDANELLATDAATAYTVLGGIGALHHDADAARSYHGKALRLNDSVETRYNCAVSFGALGLNSEALDLLRPALDVAPNRPSLVAMSIAHAIDSGYFLEARDLAERWNSVAPGQPNPMRISARLLADAVAHGVFGEDATKVVLAILSAVQGEGRIRSATSEVSSDPTEPNSFLYKRRVLATPSRAAELNEAFADRIASRPELLEDPGRRFVAMFIGVRNVGHCT